MMERPVLVFAEERAGVHVRIWRYEDGRFLFERVSPTGKGIAVFCPTFEKALELWCQSGSGTEPSEPESSERE